MNKFGYGLEFDKQGRIPGYRIDIDAMAEHLYQLSIASRRHGIAIERVILDPDLMKTMFLESRRGAALQGTLPFMKSRPWIRHDEHYHVDFRIPCRPLRDYPDKCSSRWAQRPASVALTSMISASRDCGT